jgi:hypothetical protein
MAITERRYAVFARAHEEIYERAEDIGNLWLKANGRDREYIEHIDFDSYSMTIHTSQSCCGYYESDHHTIPASYLWDEEWMEKEKTRQAEEQRKKEHREKARKLKEEKAAEERRREQYLKLKEEFEDK